MMLIMMMIMMLVMIMMIIGVEDLSGLELVMATRKYLIMTLLLVMITQI
jgi:hypothetical protein